jgi:hypothetical protein
MTDIESNEEKGQYIKNLPEDARNVSDKVDIYISNRIKSVEDFVKDYTLDIYYSSSLNQFYLKKNDYYKKLYWKEQIIQGKKGPYTYRYITIPYKKKAPVKILESCWLKRVEGVILKKVKTKDES